MTHRERYTVRLGDRGRLVLPAELRRRAGLREGQELVLVYADGVVRMATRRELARAGRGMFADAAAGRSLMDELIHERRQEARVESERPHPASGSRRT